MYLCNFYYTVFVILYKIPFSCWNHYHSLPSNLIKNLFPAVVNITVLLLLEEFQLNNRFKFWLLLTIHVGFILLFVVFEGTAAVLLIQHILLECPKWVLVV